MSDLAEKLIEQALNLPAEERAAVAERLPQVWSRSCPT